MKEEETIVLETFFGACKQGEAGAGRFPDATVYDKDGV